MGAGRQKAPTLGAEDLSCRYRRPEVTALSGVTLSLERGELVALMGASGAGKTTLLKCLNRVIPSFESATLSGRVAVGGRWLEREGIGDLAGEVGMLFQDFEAQLFSTDVGREVAFGVEQLGVETNEARERVEWALSAVGLAGLSRRDPSTLSGGQKQRVAVAALLAMRPRAMLLDEPATDLDPQGRVEVYETLGRLRSQGLAMLTVEHEVESVLGADAILLMRGGRIVANGRPGEIASRVELFEEAGVRPLELARLFRSLGLEGFALSAEEAAGAIERAGWRAAEESGSEEEMRAGGPLVSLEEVSFGYEGGEFALRDVSCTIGEGEFVALVGRNGSGKTTLAKQINGLLRPRSGRVIWRGRELSAMPRRKIAASVGYVFQNPDHQLFAPTVFEEVAFGPRNFGLGGAALGRRVEEAIAAVGLEGFEEKDPFWLTKGERQRLAIASVISLDPEMLILDEPTTGLDYRQAVEIMRLLERLNRQGRTVVMITHSPWLVAGYASRVLVMEEGELRWAGAPREFLLREELLAKAGFEAPAVAAVSRRLGARAVTVEELVGKLKKREGADRNG